MTRRGFTQLFTGSSASFAGLTGNPTDNTALAAALTAKLNTTGGTITGNGAASTPALRVNGSVFTGGSSTTTKPLVLIEPSAATSTGWDTNGCLLGTNAASGFTGCLIAAQLNGVDRFKVASTGQTTLGNSGLTAHALALVTAYGQTQFAMTGAGNLQITQSVVVPGNGFVRFGYSGSTDPIMTGTASLLTLSQGSLALEDARNIQVGSTTGAKIATATTQKLGFWNATPVVQQVLATGSTTDQVITLLQTLGLCRQS